MTVTIQEIMRKFMYNFYHMQLHLYISDLDTQYLIDLNNILITQQKIGKPHMKNYNQELLIKVKQELIKRELFSEYVLDYAGKL